MANLPYQEEARALGYTINLHSADRTYASYSKGGIFLDVYLKDFGLYGELSFLLKTYKMTTMRFSLPHPRFAVFERDMMLCKASLDALFDEGDA